MCKSLTEKDFDQIESWIGTGPKTFNLLYSITRDACDASAFHQKCDNQGPTLTVLYNKEGSVYGGYTSISWETRTVSGKNDNLAFIYQFYFSSTKTPKKFPIKNGHKAIQLQSNIGPLFGDSVKRDMYTFSNTIEKSFSGEYHLNGEMGINFGYNYETRGTSYTEVNNGHVRVTELEVYAVKDGQRGMPDLPIPWRKTAEWGPKFLDSLKEEVKGIKPPAGLDVQHFNILLLGPLSSGKSSFCNLVASVFRGRISHRARVGGNTQTSTTTLFTPYDFGDKASLQLYDTSGIYETNTLDLLQCNYILEGKIPDFYEITPKSLISNDDADFQQRPTLSNKMHCAVFVLDGSTVDDISTHLLQKIMSYRDLLNIKEIPQAVLVTNIDKLCENISKTFMSLTVKEVVNKVAVLLKLPRNCILPVKNYEEEMESDENVNILALLAVRQILFFAEDYLESRKVKQIRRRGKANSGQGESEVFGSDTA